MPKPNAANPPRPQGHRTTRPARAIAARRDAQAEGLARAALIGGAAALALAAATIGTADAQERMDQERMNQERGSPRTAPEAPALDYDPAAETTSRTVQGGQPLIGDRPERGGAAARDVARETDGWSLAPAGSAAEPAAEPEGYSGAYRLVSVNGQDLPIRIDRIRRENGQVCEEYVLSGAIQLFPDNTYVVRNLTRLDCPGGSQDRRREVERGTWKLTGNAVYLNEDRIRGEQPAHGQFMAEVPIDNLGGTGELEGRRLIIGLEDGRSVAVFEATDRSGPG